MSPAFGPGCVHMCVPVCRCAMFTRAPVQEVVQPYYALMVRSYIRCAPDSVNKSKSASGTTGRRVTVHTLITRPTQEYAQMLEQQTQQGDGDLGAPLNNEAMDALSAEQLGQLSVLREEATKLQQP